jgi:hypothetical protein
MFKCMPVTEYIIFRCHISLLRAAGGHNPASLPKCASEGSKALYTHTPRTYALPHNMQVHPKITLVNRRKYWDIGGCDEDFVRVYGFGDGGCTYIQCSVRVYGFGDGGCTVHIHNS